jgi:Mg2+/Co2+ transporter CorB
LTNKSLGVMTHLMQISNVKIFNKLISLKVSFVKTGIFLSLAAYWGVIIVGTFITFN